MENNDAIKQMAEAFNKAMKTLPVVVGNEVVNFSKDAFTKQGWLDSSFTPWRKRRSKKQQGRAILVQSGRLKRGVRVVKTTSDTVVVGNDAPYAKAHNEGFNGTVSVKPHQRNVYKKTKVGTGKTTKSGKERMKTVKSISGSVQIKAHKRTLRLPKRKFLGTSDYLMVRLKRTAALHILKQLR